MWDITYREVILHSDNEWVAFEADHWPPLLRLVTAYGLDRGPYALPRYGVEKAVSEADSKRLVKCLRNALDDIPDEDCQIHHRNEPSSYTTSPHEWFSGVGKTYLTGVSDFIDGRAFSLQLTQPGTTFIEQGIVQQPFATY